MKEEIETKEAALTNVNKDQGLMVKEKDDLLTEVERGIIVNIIVDNIMYTIIILNLQPYNMGLIQ